MRLQHRLILFLLVPVACVLTGAGAAGLFFSEHLLLQEWQKRAISKLRWAAHHIDMRLQRPLNWMEIFDATGSLAEGGQIQSWLIDQVESMKGVVKVEITWNDEALGSVRDRGHMHHGRGPGRMGSMNPREMGMMRFHRARVSQVTPPVFDTEAGEKTVRVVSELQNEDGKAIGSMKVALRFSYLMENILALGRWRGGEAYLVDDKGRVLAGTDKRGAKKSLVNGRAGAVGEQVMHALKEDTFGTLPEKGHFPETVAGFYRLELAPWSLVLFAPGNEVFAPLITFRNLYIGAAVACVLFILFYIRMVAGQSVKRIEEVSQAADSIAKGEYGEPLPETGARDEIRHLTRSFNRMVEGLRERDFIRNTFGRYVDREVAEEILARPETARLGGERREVAMLMSDIRGFTSIAESLAPEDTVKLLNSYFDRMIRVIRKYRGVIVDFFGDSLLVFFDPLDQPAGPMAEKGAECALAMMEGLRAYNDSHRGGRFPELTMGIGLHQGEVVVGNIGSRERAKYGIVGSSVNLVSRIQAVAEAGEILASGAVYELVREKFYAGPPRNVHLKGISGPVRLYPLYGRE